MRCGEIILKTADTTNQTDIIEKMLLIITKDKPVDRIKRMVRLESTIHQCVRKINESMR